MSKVVKWTADQVRAQLQDRYQQPEYALLFEVRNGTGSHGNRSADALAMDMYPSRGLAMHGFEIKVSRGDYLKELKDGSKAEAIAQYCDHWWLVAPGDVVKDDLPIGWGWLKPTANGLRVCSQAPKQETVPIPRSFLASMLRSANYQADSLLEAAVANRTTALEATTAEYRKQILDLERQLPRGRVKETLAAVEQLKDMTGFDLNGWGDNEVFFSAVRAVLAVGPARAYGGATAALATMNRATAELNNALRECGLTSDTERG